MQRDMNIWSSRLPLTAVVFAPYSVAEARTQYQRMRHEYWTSCYGMHNLYVDSNNAPPALSIHTPRGVLSVDCNSRTTIERADTNSKTCSRALESNQLGTKTSHTDERSHQPDLGAQSEKHFNLNMLRIISNRKCAMHVRLIRSIYDIEFNFFFYIFAFNVWKQYFNICWLLKINIHCNISAHQNLQSHLLHRNSPPSNT